MFAKELKKAGADEKVTGAKPYRNERKNRFLSFEKSFENCVRYIR